MSNEVERVAHVLRDESRFPSGTARFSMARARELARAAISALDDGWRPVPREPSEAQIRAVDAALHEKWPNARAMAVAADRALVDLPSPPGGEGGTKP